MICGVFSRITLSDSPSRAAFSTMFCRPVSSGWNAEPSSRMEATLPRTASSPELGAVIPEEDFQQRALAGAVLSDEAETLAGRDLEADVVEGVKGAVPGPPGEELHGAAHRIGVHPVDFAEL